MSRRIIIASVAAGVVAVSAAAGAFVYLNNQEQARLDVAARTSADRFASAWSHRDVQNVAYAGQSAAQVAASFKNTTSGLGSTPAKVTVTSLTRDGDKASGELSVVWTVGEDTTWPYQMPINLQRDDKDTWGVVAKGGASMWAPGLSPKAKLVASRTSGSRGEILDRHGVPIVTVGKVYDVAIDPNRASEQTVAELEKLVKEPSGSLVAKLTAAKASGSKGAIPVTILRDAPFQNLKPQLDALKGVIYPSRQQPLASIARPLLGSYGPVTAETVKNSKGRYVAGDYAGFGGLQGQYNTVLDGTPGFKVTSTDKPGVALVEKPATDGKPLTLTLDTKTQKAAEAALVGGKSPSALVAVDVATGDLLAVANAPEGGMNRALLSRYAPGSTLKVATTYSLLSKGMSPSKPVNCPPSITIQGTTMVNYEHESGGMLPFSTDFAMSCNTAFVGVSQTMGASDVHDGALALGVGAPWGKHLGLDGAFQGSVPVATSKTEKATSAFGQGRTEASPAALAVMAASVARGTYIEPALIKSPAVAGADRAPKPLDAKAASELRTLMRLVVTSGTARGVLTSVPGGPVYGKTGTAEYGTSKPLPTHAWFIGWQGNVAFAVLVEDGASGATVAGPIAAHFLENLQH
ncbi:MAG: penicillin-binding transpeptidase domain-containing protein [Actinomycetota bacterium]